VRVPVGHHVLVEPHPLAGLPVLEPVRPVAGLALLVDPARGLREALTVIWVSAPEPELGVLIVGPGRGTGHGLHGRAQELDVPLARGASHAEHERLGALEHALVELLGLEDEPVPRDRVHELPRPRMGAYVHLHHRALALDRVTHRLALAGPIEQRHLALAVEIGQVLAAHVAGFQAQRFESPTLGELVVAVGVEREQDRVELPDDLLEAQLGLAALALGLDPVGHVDGGRDHLQDLTAVARDRASGLMQPARALRKHDAVLVLDRTGLGVLL